MQYGFTGRVEYGGETGAFSNGSRFYAGQAASISEAAYTLCLDDLLTDLDESFSDRQSVWDAQVWD